MNCVLKHSPPQQPQQDNIPKPGDYFTFQSNTAKDTIYLCVKMHEVMLSDTFKNIDAKYIFAVDMQNTSVVWFDNMNSTTTFTKVRPSKFHGDTLEFVKAKTYDQSRTNNR